MAKIDLPEPGEPLRTSRGEIAPTGSPRVVEIPTNGEAVAIIEGTRRKLQDLPVSPRAMNPVAVVCIYTMYGLDTAEISIATGIPIDQILNIRMSGEYGLIQRAVVDTVMETETGEVKDFITRATRKAAQKVERLIDSPHVDVALKAAKDVLDRGGLRPVDVVEVRKKMEGGLTIEVIDRRNESQRPVIDLKPEE